ncbi:MAG: YbaN family protein [Acidimicrobiia bacterium]
MIDDTSLRRGDTSFDLRLTSSRPARILFGVLGTIFLAIGIAGTVLPVLPGTVNLLVALYFFSRSSERMHRWMLTNRYFGQTLRDYKAGLGMPRRIKFVAVISIILAAGISAGFVIEPLWLRLLVAAVAVYGIWYVLTRPTYEVEVASRRAADGAPG